LNVQRVGHGKLGGARQVVDDEVDEVFLRDLVAHLARGLRVPGLLVAEPLTLHALLGMTASHFDGFEADFIAFLEIGGSNSRNVKSGRPEVRHGQDHDQQDHGYLYVHHFAFCIVFIVQLSYNFDGEFTVLAY